MLASWDRDRSIRFALYLAAVSSILVMAVERGVLLLVPPYAASAYLAIFESGSKFSGRSNIVASYLFVIASSEAIHMLLGSSLLAMALNVYIA